MYMSFDKISVLIVDDSKPVRVKIKQICNDMGIRKTFEAADGKEAVGVLVQNEISLVITDWNMPNLPGDTLVGLMKQNDKLKRIPILLISTESQKAGILELIMKGVNGYIVKPFTDATVKEKICAALKVPLPGTAAAKK
jgi:two-component system, chemotaxis family, chemotaxis protein CheY